MSKLHVISFVLLVVGGLNWGLVGLFDYNLVDSLLPDSLAMVVYVLVGLSAVWEAVNHKKNCRHCSSGSIPMA